MTFTFNLSDCQTSQGLQAGIFEGSCDGSKVLDCNAQCNTGTFALTGFLESCNVYYLWMDGCNADVCMFTLSVSAGSGSGRLPRPMPRPIVKNTPCVCGEAEIEFPGYLGDECTGNLTWKVNGIPAGTPGDQSIIVPVPDESPIQVCVKNILGGGGTVCDADSTCIFVRPQPIPKIPGLTRRICFEDQPYFWNGVEILQSCISPPCSSRFTLGNGCCIDSLIPIRLLPLYPVLKKEVFYCASPPDINPHRSEDGKAWLNDVCDELIEFSHPISGCDTSIYLDVRYFQYSKSQLSQCPPCSGERALCPNVRYTPDCLEFDDGRVQILLEWFSSPDSIILDSLYGQECFEPDSLGRYCYNMFSIFNSDTCFIEKVCFEYDTTIITHPVIEKFACDSNRVTFVLSDTTGLCFAEWNASEGDKEILGLFGDTLVVTFRDTIPDSVEITLMLNSDCFVDTVSEKFHLIESSSSDTVIICSSLVPYNWQGNTVDSSGEYKYRSVLQGCIVDSIRFFQIKMDSILGTIDTVICFLDKDTNYFKDANGKIYKRDVQGEIIDLGGLHHCDSLFELNLTYQQVQNLNVIDTIICGLVGEDLKYIDVYGNEFDKSTDSLLVSSSKGLCDGFYILNLAIVKIGFDWEQDCSCNFECIEIDPQLTVSDTNVQLRYTWISSSGDTIQKGQPKLFACEDDVHCLQVHASKNGVECHMPIEICEPINESVLLPKTQLVQLKKDEKKLQYEYELQHTGIQTCHLSWYITFNGLIELLNPQKTRVRVIGDGKVRGKKEVCSIFQFSCGKRDTLCQSIRFKEGNKELPTGPTGG